MFHITLLGWDGCIADSYDAAAWFGDDIRYRGVYDVDMKPLPFLGGRGSSSSRRRRSGSPAWHTRGWTGPAITVAAPARVFRWRRGSSPLQTAPPPAIPDGDEPRASPAGLTARELEVLTLLACGASNRLVARALGITPKTAGNHIERIYIKAQVTTRAAATLFAMEHGLLTTPAPVG